MGKYRVALDAGHGSQTAGKRTPDGYREHWINVTTAYYAKLAAERCGIDVVKVGWDDKNPKDDPDIGIVARQNKVRVTNCDASVSFHANACGDGKSYNSGAGASAHIHNDATKIKDSKRLAEYILKYLPEGTEQKNRGVVRQNLGMCNAVYMRVDAAVLVEIGFMTNKHEAELMKTDKFCKEQGEDVVKGLCRYFGISYVPERVEYTVDHEPFLNLRDGANLKNTKILVHIKNGTKVLYLHKQTKDSDGRVWYKVKYNGTEGWMSAKYLKKV